MMPACNSHPALRGQYHDLDALRGILMSLGVVLHAADVYASGKPWLVSDAQRLDFFAAIVAGIHLFRIPAFFIISGFFSRMLLDRRGPALFLRERGMRLVVPLVSTALLLNSAQALLLAACGKAPLSDYYERGGCVSHLWFLLDLIVYTLVLAAAWPLLHSTRPERTPLLKGAIILLLPLSNLAARALAHFSPAYSSVPGQLLDIGELLHYFPFFAFGALYQPGRDGARLGHMARGALALLLTGLVGKRLLAGRVVELFCYSALEWSVALLCLYLARRYLRGRSRVFRSLAAASYTVYLVHQVLVVAVGLALLSAPLSAAGKFLIVVTAVFPLCLGVHFLFIKPNPLCYFLFNGKLPAKARLAQATTGEFPAALPQGAAAKVPVV